MNTELPSFIAFALDAGCTAARVLGESYTLTLRTAWAADGSPSGTAGVDVTSTKSKTPFLRAAVVPVEDFVLTITL